MKIGLIHNLYGEFSHGGAETAVMLMARELEESGNEVFLITTKPRKATPGESELKVHYISSRFYNLSATPVVLRIFWHIGEIFSLKYRTIKKILKTEKPDLVITHNILGLGLLTPLAIRKLKIKHWHFLHDIQLLHPSGLMIFGKEKKLKNIPAKIYQRITKGLIASPEKVISPSEWLLKIHQEKNFFKNSKTEIKPFRWPQAEKNISDKNKKFKKFLFIGQMEKQKGVFLLIDAFKEINNPDISLTFAFRHNQQNIAAVKKAADKDKRISFRGPLDYEQTRELMIASDCLIVPSLCYENSPTTIHGAKAAGLAVIAAAIGGIPEIIGEEKLFNPGDKKDLIEKIKETL
ncbi:MAG: glycosyltransferase [Patescibacteria group bacterium]|jgi:glycosyltransferase involved in cell wall biosynthesis